MAKETPQLQLKIQLPETENPQNDLENEKEKQLHAVEEVEKIPASMFVSIKTC